MSNKSEQQAVHSDPIAGSEPTAVLETAVEVWRAQEDETTIEKGIDQVASEVAVALVYNGVSHVVMMASPINLEAFALGFSLTEGIVDKTGDIYEIQIQRLEAGIEILLTISSHCFSRLKDKRRNLAGRSGCGLCGAESLQQVRLPLPRVVADFEISHRAVEHATRALREHQPLQALTGGVHGAGWFNAEGELLQLCEDVGRHNALDKLIGSLCQNKLATETGAPKQAGFLLVSSRASYEILQKCAMANIGVIVALSAPTALAIDIARDADITLVGFSRENRHIAYTHSRRLLEQQL